MRSNKKQYESPQMTFRQFSGDCEIVRTSGEAKAALSWGSEWGSWTPSRPDTVIGEE